MTKMRQQLSNLEMYVLPRLLNSINVELDLYKWDTVQVLPESVAANPSSWLAFISRSLLVVGSALIQSYQSDSLSRGVYGTCGLNNP